MADVQDDLENELIWYLRALTAADQLSEDRAEIGGLKGSVATLCPSLHLNLGEVYRKLGNLTAAREHLNAGQSAAKSLDADGYEAMIRRGLQGLNERLDYA